ncbi:PAS domain-containing protein [Horticoccus sp. 23ND18S-11]|uniref:PAS domain-containing protein n=1 Tax=Horticoccus sp. 23ND18S-11 TaxID=3391832 RepID=UPI0039C95869
MVLEDNLRRIAGWLGLITAALGAVVLAGWMKNTNPLDVLHLNSAPMTPNAALCLLLAGVSLWLQLRTAPLARRCGLTSAAIALLVALAALAHELFQVDLGLDRLLASALRSDADSTPLRMSVHAALIIAASAVALVGLRQARSAVKWPISAWMANLVIGLSAAVLMGVEFATSDDIVRPLRFSSHLALGLLVLGIGTLLARPGDPHMRALFARSTIGTLARRLFIFAAIVPLVISGILAWLVRNEIVTLADSVVLFVVAIMLCGIGVALLSLVTTAGISESREEAEQARAQVTARLQEQTAQLQDTIARRTAELREANASLRAAADSNALLALVAQNTVNGVVITDATGRIEWCNAAFTRVTGYEFDEIKGRKPGHFLQGAGTDPVTIAKLRAAERDGQPCNVEILNYTKRGTPFWQIIDLQPVRDQSGRLVHFIANQTDITGQRADKTRLEHLNQRFELAARAAHLGVWEWDAATQRSIWDQRTLEIYGVHADDFKGTLEDWKRRVHPEDRDAAIARIQAAMASSSHFEQEFRILRASDGAERFLQSRAIVQRDAQGRLLRITGTERDITAERESSQKMEALYERLRLALRSSNYGVWEYDLVTGKRIWDDRILEMFGMTRAEFDDSRPMWLERIHPEDRGAAAENMRRVIAGELPEYVVSFRIVRPDGTIRHTNSHGYLHRDQRGNPVRLVGLSRDVTNEKQMAQALDLAEQRWQLAIEGTNDSVWDWDIVTGRIFHDERWARMLGYAPGELEDTIAAWNALVHPDDLAGTEAAVYEHFEERTKDYQHALRFRAKDGTWRWILDRGKVVRRSEDGRPLRMAGTHSDITEHKLLEQRLRKSEELASEVSRLAQIGGWELDMITRRVTWTDGTRRIHEVDDTYLPTMESMWQFYPADTVESVKAAFNDVTPASPSFDIEVPFITARGRRLWVRILGHGEFMRGRALNVHGAIQDVTSRHESEGARRQLETQLFQAQKMETLGTLAGGIAHDFNNLLTGIIGYHELAADSLPEDHPARTCLVEARNASLRARELVEQILTFGRQTGGAVYDPIDLPLVVEEARRFLRATLPSNITIDVAFAPNCGSVLADATQIHQLILNLGSNAAHAMRQHGGHLKIAIEPTEVTPDLALTLGNSPASSYVRLSISDTGHGMDEATRRRIFDPFFTTKNTREGTGLGLAVVHGIVRSHRGAIDVESAPGQGSTFHIYLPAAKAETETEPTDLTMETAPRGGGEYVCVVDDEEVVGSCTKLVLANKGYHSLVFASAEKCLAELESNLDQCSVLITDQTMPGMQGTELATTLRRRRPDLPVVIMSGYFSKISPQALDDLGQVELLGKPFTTDELLHAVHRALHPVAKIS